MKLLYVGRLVKLKGVDSLITEFSNICNNHDLILDIVGDGPEKEQLVREVEKLNLSNKVFFHGFKTDITSYLSDADLFIYPSYSEIFGISIVEAMAFKCVCIASNVGGIPEIIKNGINGFLNISNTSDELREKMYEAIALCANWNARNSMMENARITAESFTIEKTIGDLEAMYQELK